jgi:hypothetical protein
MPISTDDLKDMSHMVVVQNQTTLEMTEFEGAGCMERAHVFATQAALNNPGCRVIIGMRYRTMTQPDYPRVIFQ